MVERNSFDKTILRSKDIAELTGITPRALRHYLQLGLIEEPARDSNGYRNFNATHVIQILRIKLLAESGASLKRIAYILETHGEPSLEDLEDIDEELAHKEELLRQQRAALHSLKESTRPKSPTKTAQFDADVGLMMSETNQLPDTTLALIQDTLNSPDIAVHAEYWMKKFEALEGANSISAAEADELAHDIAEFYSVIAQKLESITPMTDSPIPDLIDDLGAERLSPAQAVVWEKFLAQI